MGQIDDSSWDVLRQAMYWEEKGTLWFHRNAYCFAKSLRPLLKSDSNSSSMSVLLLFIMFVLFVCGCSD
jgi:hypothetical protein